MGDVLRVVSWNCRRASRQSPLWDYLLKLAPDVALLQEVGTIPAFVQRHFAILQQRAVQKRGGLQRFTTAVLVRGKLDSEVVLAATEDWVSKELAHLGGNLVGVRVVPDSGPPLMAISVHSPAWPLDRARVAGIDVTKVRLSQNADVWAADLLWAGLQCWLRESDRHWIVAGDFNSSPTFDEGPGGARGNQEYLERMAGLGLVECLRRAQGVLTPTFRSSRSPAVKHQIDHLFVSAALSDNLRSCNVGPQSVVFGANLSDHLPIIAEFDALC